MCLYCIDITTLVFSLKCPLCRTFLTIGLRDDRYLGSLARVYEYDHEFA